MLDRTLPGIQQLQRVAVLMMENRSFDHMLGALQSVNPSIDGSKGDETNPDTTGVLGLGEHGSIWRILQSESFQGLCPKHQEISTLDLSGDCSEIGAKSEN